MEQNKHTTLRFNTWNEYRKFIDELSENWAFRGQADATWVLQNAIERTDFIKLYKGIEVDFLAEFQRGARNYLNKDETPEHLIEWLALMQHHGAPTRLLDFSKSPFIGAYFAFEESVVQQSNYVSVWAINIDFLKNRSLEELSVRFAEDLRESKNLVDEKLFEKIFFDNSCSLIFPVEPFRMNRRYSLQQSIFVSTGNSYESFMQQLNFLRGDIGKAVIKVEMPSQLQKEALRDLQRMNLHRASLFPDLDGYAASLRLRYNSMKSPEEARQEYLKKTENKDFNFFP
ncbi:MAG: FRG domain-containing protein [Chitinophagaceae bacterium]|nr:FRG domain-containing protein [Chitinophagaceae bacterium]